MSWLLPGVLGRVARLFTAVNSHSSWQFISVVLLCKQWGNDTLCSTIRSKTLVLLKGVWIVNLCKWPGFTQNIKTRQSQTRLSQQSLLLDLNTLGLNSDIPELLQTFLCRWLINVVCFRLFSPSQIFFFFISVDFLWHWMKRRVCCHKMKKKNLDFLLCLKTSHTFVLVLLTLRLVYQKHTPNHL